MINDEVIKAVEECNDLAPLHNPANLIGINVCKELMPGVPMVAVFDTAFHQTMPAKAYLYGLPIEYYEKYKVRRYGCLLYTSIWHFIPGLVYNQYINQECTKKIIGDENSAGKTKI